MPRKPETRIVKLTRVRSLPSDSCRTLQYTTPDLPLGHSGRCRLTFISPENVPEFDGEEAWFEVERVSAKPWPFWKAVRQVDPPAGR